MAAADKFWRVARQDEALIEELCASTGYSQLMCRVCVNRGLLTEKAITEFMTTNIDETIGFSSLKGVDVAVQRIARAIADDEIIVIYGDYDVDGITSTALMVKVLRDLGAKFDKVLYYIPERQAEGYGLNADALEFLAGELRANLIITVDCGISGFSEVEGIAGKLDIIITDHHQPPDKIPEAYAVINPKLEDCLYPFKQLAGVGVAYKLCLALCNHQQVSFRQEYLDLVAIGTIADMVPLIGENRVIVKHGLQQIKHGQNTGLKALVEISGLGGQKEVTADNVGYSLAPRLNAAGRLSQATLSVELLLTEDVKRAEEIAVMLNEENIARQQCEREIFAQADALLINSGRKNDRVIVLAGDWHSGVIGIVASRLVAKYYRPVVIISLRDGIGKGSCRSIHSFNLYSALSECSDILLGFGGHYFAAGLTIDAALIHELALRLNSIAERDLQLSDFFAELEIDAEIAINEINMDTYKELKELEPFGVGNSKPIFALRNINARGSNVTWRLIGNDQRHLKLTFSTKAGQQIDALCWDMADCADVLDSSLKFSLAATLESNFWRDVERLQLKASGIIVEDSFVDRDFLVQVFSKLKLLKTSGQQVRIDKNFVRETNDNGVQCSWENIETALKIFREIGLLDYCVSNDPARFYSVSLGAIPDRKLDLFDSPTFVFATRQKQLLESGCFHNAHSTN